MDYIFFGFSSLSFCLCLLLIFYLALGRDGPLRLWQVLAAVLAGLAYYYLDFSVFHKVTALYYLGNIVPQIVLAGLVILTLLQPARARRV